VSETFESGPGRFNDAEDPAAIQYPAKVPEAAALAERLDAIDRDLRTAQIAALAALVVAIALPVGMAFMRRRA